MPFRALVSWLTGRRAAEAREREIHELARSIEETHRNLANNLDSDSEALERIRIVERRQNLKRRRAPNG
jgi:hypothetical protein